MKNKKNPRFWKKIGVLLCALCLAAGSFKIDVRAASGSVYTSTITRCYRHPVTGAIEDSGGESGYATGQGMVEGCVGATGLLEVTDSGEYYLTFRMSLMDYTTDHSFLVQNVGDSGWKEMALGQTGSGTDSSGTTADVCVQVPSENCIVRISMYVTAMGRNVVFYIYPGDYQQGNQTGFQATMVTESTPQTDGTSSGQTAANSNTASGSASQSSTDKNPTAETGTSADKKETQTSADTTKKEETAASTVIEKTETEDTKEDTTEKTKTSESSSLTSILDSADGLSLSTDAEQEESSENVTTEKESSIGTIFATAAAVTISGVILMWSAAGIGYLFRKNWYRWGGGKDDEEE